MVNIMYYLNVFFAFSIIGHLLENIFNSHIDSGILLLPWTPIYGVGVIIIIFINNIIKRFELSIFVCCAPLLRNDRNGCWLFSGISTWSSFSEL